MDQVEAAVERGTMAAIRTEQDGDAAAIHAVHAEAFPTQDEARLVDSLRAAGNLDLSLVALVDEVVVGHVAFSPVTLRGERLGLGLAPVAVTSAHRRKGIADELIRMGLATCARRGHGFVVVLGDPEYYGRFGFLPASDWDLSDEYGGGAAFQAIELREGSIPVDGGLVQYTEQFAEMGGEETP